jgi:predicted negative regulator of RcsB-dependent stress response
LVLDDGIAKLGPIVSLQIPAIAFEVQAKHWDAALRRVDTIAAKSPRKDLWLKRRGEILRQAGRKRLARDAFKAALAALRAWPPDVRSQPANKALAAELEGAIRLLGK